MKSNACLKIVGAQLKLAFLLLFTFSILTGVVYPAFVTLIAQTIFPENANGRLIRQGNILIGSELIGQYFDRPQYFWGRPSATLPFPYNAEHSLGSNLAPGTSLLKESLNRRIGVLKKSTIEPDSNIPIDLITSSSSGLDPHISPESAFYQISRVARQRNIHIQALRLLVEQHIEGQNFGFLGQPRVNVLKLNLALDAYTLKKNPKEVIKIHAE